MEELVFEPTLKSPFFNLRPNGYMLIEGKAISENVKNEFTPIIKWCREISSNTVSLTIKLEYLGNASSKMMVELFKVLSINKSIRHLHVHWYFDSDDISLIETGEVFRELFPKIRFQFYLV